MTSQKADARNVKFCGAVPGSFAGTVEQWCRAFLLAPNPQEKFAAWAALPTPRDWSWDTQPAPERLEKAHRPEGWQVIERSPKTPKLGALQHAHQRAHLLHTLAHHELQAAELFAWAVLAFPDTPRAFRQGLMRIVGEELAHLELYQAHLQHLGSCYPSEPVRDWFWSRIVQCPAPIDFVAFMGLGLEGANLEHSARFAQAFRQAGDERGAGALEQVERDEVGHVAFARKWFETWTGRTLEFEDWEAHLPAPLTAAVFRGLPLNRAARRSAGLSEAFLDALESAQPAHKTKPSRKDEPGSEPEPSFTPEWIFAAARPPVVWVLNLDVEEEWAHAASIAAEHGPQTVYQRSANMQRIIVLKREPLLNSLVHSGDFVWPAGTSPVAPRGTLAIAWSPSTGAAREAEEHGWSLLSAFPEADLRKVPDAVLRKVNDKRWLASMSAKHPAEEFLPKVVCRDLDELKGIWAEHPASEWLLRRPFGAAGRQRVKVQPEALTESQRSWLAARFAEDSLVAEPFVPIEWECSTCGWIAQDGQVTTYGARFQKTDSTGAWQSAGNLLVSSKSRALGEAIAKAAQKVGLAMATEGYRGPFSVDAFAYRGADGKLRVQPWSDGNARFTMGWAASFREFQKHGPRA